MLSPLFAQYPTFLVFLAVFVAMVLTLVFTVLFPVTKKEFEIVRREIDRRKGTEKSMATPEEIKICEKVTGYKYDKLWNKDNALKLSTRC